MDILWPVRLHKPNIRDSTIELAEPLRNWRRLEEISRLWNHWDFPFAFRERAGGLGTEPFTNAFFNGKKIIYWSYIQFLCNWCEIDAIIINISIKWRLTSDFLTRVIQINFKPVIRPWVCCVIECLHICRCNECKNSGDNAARSETFLYADKSFWFWVTVARSLFFV